MAAVGTISFAQKFSALVGFRTAPKTQLVLCLSSTRILHTTQVDQKQNYDKFSWAQRKKRFRRPKEEESLDKGSGSSKPKPFQLDPLEGHHSSIAPLSARQKAVGETLKMALVQVLECAQPHSSLSQCNVEITKVKLAKDYGHATVYWRLEDDTLSEDEIQAIFDKNSSYLRQSLPSYHSLFHTPQLVFTKDREAQYLTDLHRLLDSKDK